MTRATQSRNDTPSTTAARTERARDRDSRMRRSQIHPAGTVPASSSQVAGPNGGYLRRGVRQGSVRREREHALVIG